MWGALLFILIVFLVILAIAIAVSWNDGYLAGQRAKEEEFLRAMEVEDEAEEPPRIFDQERAESSDRMREVLLRPAGDS